MPTAGPVVADDPADPAAPSLHRPPAPTTADRQGLLTVGADGRIASLGRWLDAWRAGRVAPLPEGRPWPPIR